MDYNYGQELKSARERSGLSLQAVADALHLDPQLIQAIEGEDETRLPAPAYVRGYIRAYAQLVRCEPETLISRYNTQAKSDPQLIASVHSVAASKQDRDTRLMWVGTGIVLSLLMMVVGGWLLIENLFIDEDIQTITQPPVIASPLDMQTLPDPWQPDPVLPLPEVSENIPQTVNPAPAPAPNIADAGAPQIQTPPVSQPPVATAAPAMAPVTQADTSPQIANPIPEKPVVTNAQSGNDRLGLAFDGVSWIEVLDANGIRLVHGLFDAQTQSLFVKGQAPFEVTIGDANHVDISVNGEVVSSEPYIRRNNTARFKVESSTQAQ